MNKRRPFLSRFQFALMLVCLLLYPLIPGFSAAAENWIGVTRGMTIFRQEEETWGGAACAKAILFRVTGSSFPQTALAEASGTTGEDGTTLSRLLDVINNYQSEVEYRSFMAYDEAAFSRQIREALAGNELPLVLGVQTLREGGWPYDSERGRFLMVYCVSEDGQRVGIADPYVRYRDSSRETSDHYAVSMHELYLAYLRADTGLAYPADSLQKLEFRPLEGVYTSDELGYFAWEFYNFTEQELECFPLLGIERRAASGKWETALEDYPIGGAYITVQAGGSVFCRVNLTPLLTDPAWLPGEFRLTLLLYNQRAAREWTIFSEPFVVREREESKGDKDGTSALVPGSGISASAPAAVLPERRCQRSENSSSRRSSLA